jgi:hypothetical protein
MKTPGGPCNSSCSAPRAVRAHMSASGSRGNTGIPAGSQPPKRSRRWQDIVLSASASIHQMSLRRVAEAQPFFCRPTAGKTALARVSTSGGEHRRLAFNSAILALIFRSGKAELAAKLANRSFRPSVRKRQVTLISSRPRKGPPPVDMSLDKGTARLSPKTASAAVQTRWEPAVSSGNIWGRLIAANGRFCIASNGSGLDTAPRRKVNCNHSADGGAAYPKHETT